MIGNIYPTKYMGKTTDMPGRLKFQLPVNLLFQAKPYAVDGASEIRVIDASFRSHGNF